jgi:hypothetical protein
MYIYQIHHDAAFDRPDKMYIWSSLSVCLSVCIGKLYHLEGFELVMLPFPFTRVRYALHNTQRWQLDNPKHFVSFTTLQIQQIIKSTESQLNRSWMLQCTLPRVAMTSWRFTVQMISDLTLRKVNWRFGGTYRLHPQGQRISQGRYQRGSRLQAGPAYRPLSRWFLARIILLLLIWRRYVPPKRRLTIPRYIPEDSNFTATAVRTSNPTNDAPGS